MGRGKKRGKPADEHGIRRPEANVAFYLDTAESQRYHACTQTQRIQRELAEECVRVLLKHASSLQGTADVACRRSGVQILNVGCGSGHCGAVIRENGMAWVGADISRAMLNEADAQCCSGLLLEADCFGRLPFRSASFDHGLSVSAIQWICVSESPASTAGLFFRELSRVMRENGVFVAQLYPRHQGDVDCLQTAAAEAGWLGLPYVYTGFPHQSKARKRFMCLRKSTGSSLSIICRCPLSWPLRMPCGGSDRDRLDREHRDFSAHSLRLLRRAATVLASAGSGSSGQESWYSAVDVTCPASCLTPCGGTFCVHVWSDETAVPIDDTDQAHGGEGAGRAGTVMRELLGGTEFALNVAQEKKSGVPVDWKALNDRRVADSTRLDRNPHFSLREVPDTSCFVLECPKRSPLVVVVYSLSHPRAMSESVISPIRALSSTAEAITVVGIDISTNAGGLAHAAVLMYVPSPVTTDSRTLDDTLRAVFPKK